MSKHAVLRPPEGNSCKNPIMRALSVPVLILAGLAACTANAKAIFVCPALDTDTRRAMQGWQVPGLAVSVVRNGTPVYRKSFGVADAETGRRVTEKTVFGIGSITKSMTALGFAVSDTRSTLRLDTPVRSALEYFPDGITLRHLLSHRAGWPRHDALWYLNTYGGQSLTERLARLPRYAKPGASFQYNNVPFAAAGTLLAKSAGVSWNDWIHAVLLAPAGMTLAVSRVSVFRDNPERATPYFPAREGRITLPLRDTDPVAPAAGIYANIRDMERYTALLANAGKLGKRQVIPAAAVRQLWQDTASGYGLGMRIGKWQERKLVFHPGFIDGYGARISILPEERSGVVVLSNMSGKTPVARIVSQIALDCLTDAPATDWVARFGHRRPPPEPEAALPPPVAADRSLAAYTGSFRHAAYGLIRFRPVATGQLAGQFHGRDIRLNYTGEDRWRLTDTHWPLRKGLIFSFEDEVNGRFSTVSAPLADGPTYRQKAGAIAFERDPLYSDAETPD